MADLVAAAGLRLVRFIEPARYDPASYLADARLLKAASELGPLARAAMAEKLAGNIKTHVFYVTSEEGETVAEPGPQAIPCLRETDAATLAQAVQRELALKADFDGLPIRLPLPRLAIKRRPESLFDYRFEDFEILNYESHPHIAAKVAV